MAHRQKLPIFWAMDDAGTVLDFWFGAPGSAERDRPRDIWFETDSVFDATLRARFLRDHERAASGAYHTWLDQADGALALVLLLDQMPRNLFRGSPRAFASDPLAQDAARHAVSRNFDRGIAPVRRWFLYLPFQHSEILADQELSLVLTETLPEDEDKAVALDYARRHHAVIARFGRFPHRNGVLGRPSTPAEEAFLRETPVGF
jgi:uncharacterized protein (DUF924 family)